MQEYAQIKIINITMNENFVPELPTSDEGTQPELTTEPQLPSFNTMTKEEILNLLKDSLTNADIPSRAYVDSLKQAFYKLKSTENEAAKQKFIEEGGDPSEYVQTPDPAEEEIKNLLNEIKEKKAKSIAEEEKVKEENFSKKSAIIDAIKELTDSSDDFGKLYKEFKELQIKWNDIKIVPEGKAKELWRSYQIYTEKFYDLIKINNELRDYDFKKNLELKNVISDSVEKLDEETDVISAFHQLQNFHQQWRDIGPVAKELREEIWNRFKEASTKINKKYQDHFIQLKEKEEQNLEEKTAICQEIKDIDYSVLQSAKEWDDKTKAIISLQEKWKTIGFVPRKVNTQIFEEFRSLCDVFFEKKAAFFKTIKEGMDANLEKKRKLTEKVNELKESTNWKETADELINIQKEWKKIGPIPRKYSESLWKEFIGACDYFFEQRSKVLDTQKEEETVNLAAKKEVIEKIKALDINSDPKELLAQLKAHMNEWNAIGFVPFKEKDKIYKEYQGALDVYFEQLKINKAEYRLQSFKNTVDDISKTDKSKPKLLRERDKLIHQYNKVKSDLQTYENNMGFLSLSKGASSLLKDMNHRIEDLKNEMELILKKIEAIDSNLE